MLKDVVPFAELPEYAGHGVRERAVRAFVEFIERKLGIDFLVERATHQGLTQDTVSVAQALRRSGTIAAYHPLELPPDEPKIPTWKAHYKIGRNLSGASAGSSMTGNDRALIATLAEALERVLWYEADDYFFLPQRAAFASLNERATDPARFAGFSREMREQNRALTLSTHAEFLWVRGVSLTDGEPILVPAQVVSGKRGSRVQYGKTEPLILSPITTGLATGQTREDAALGGILEIIERDAFMLTWLNQLTPPLAGLEALANEDSELALLLRLCERYRLGVEVALLPTDAPAHAVCAVIRDAHGGPEIVVGLRAHRSLARAAEGAILEALRMRSTLRSRAKRGVWEKEVSKNAVIHLERADYWAHGGRYANLAFLTSGTKCSPHAAWEHDTAPEHLTRLVSWCRARGYECAVVDLGCSRMNPTSWHVCMAVMPDMHPLHQNEHMPYTESARLSEVPALLGYAPRKEPYLGEPHPFA